MSGTGKTATFAVSILQKIDVSAADCQALVLAPTRELAQQIVKVVRALGDFMQLQVGDDDDDDGLLRGCDGGFPASARTRSGSGRSPEAEWSPLPPGWFCDRFDRNAEQNHGSGSQRISACVEQSDVQTKAGTPITTSTFDLPRG